MKTGTKSLLFGVHQFLWHPITVWIAWVWLYRKLPTWRETICIIIHDWGYWGKANMDDEEGEKHPEVGAKIAAWLFDRRGSLLWDTKGNGRYMQLVLLHSRHYARNWCQDPSLLCWADKLSIIFEPWWLYLPRAWASGELAEYRKIAAGTGFVPLTASHREWYRWIQDRLSTLGREKRGDVVPTSTLSVTSDNGFRAGPPLTLINGYGLAPTEAGRARGLAHGLCGSLQVGKLGQLWWLRHQNHGSRFNDAEVGQ